MGYGWTDKFCIGYRLGSNPFIVFYIETSEGTIMPQMSLTADTRFDVIKAQLDLLASGGTSEKGILVAWDDTTMQADEIWALARFGERAPIE